MLQQMSDCLIHIIQMPHFGFVHYPTILLVHIAFSRVSGEIPTYWEVNAEDISQQMEWYMYGVLLDRREGYDFQHCFS